LWNGSMLSLTTVLIRAKHWPSLKKMKIEIKNK
jgi:hypothetical protein